MVHQDHVIACLYGHLECRSSAQYRIYRKLGIGKELLLNFKVHFIVIDNEDLRIGRLKAALILAALRDLLVLDVQFADERLVRNALLYGNGKGRALTVNAVNRNISAHQLNELLHDAEAQTGTLDISVLLLIDTFERVEQVRNDLLLDTHSGIGYGNEEHHRIVIGRLALDMELHRTLCRIFNGVVQKIDDDLLDPDLIAVKHRGNLRINADFELKSLVMRLEPDHVYDLREQVVDTVIHRDNVHASGFHL